MLFIRLVFIAFATSIIVGAVLGLVEQFTTVPVILHAERYEHAETGHAHDATAAAHEEHTHESAWEPSDGFERTVFTVIADMSVVFGFSLLLMVFMCAATHVRGTPVSPGNGALWGFAAFLVVFLAPAFGLPPETPGTFSAPLIERQLWWLATVVIAALSLGALVFAHGRWKLIAFVLIPWPYLLGAPEIAGSKFAGHGAAEIAALEDLGRQFIWTTGLTNFVLWLVLGTVGGWALKRWVSSAALDRGSQTIAPN